MSTSITMRMLPVLAAAMAVGMGSVRAAEEAAPPAAPAPEKRSTPAPENTSTNLGAPLVITGTIVVVDKTAGMLTLEVDGKLRELAVGPRAKMVNNGKLVTMSELAAGQRVAVLTRSRVDGRPPELVALSVQPSSTKAAAAGQGDGEGLAKAGESGRGPTSQPFTTLANPANNLGPIISPSE